MLAAHRDRLMDSGFLNVAAEGFEGMNVERGVFQVPRRHARRVCFRSNLSKEQKPCTFMFQEISGKNTYSQFYARVQRSLLSYTGFVRKVGLLHAGHEGHHFGKTGESPTLQCVRIHSKNLWPLPTHG